MAERTFLEKVGVLHSSNAIGSARVWEVRHLRNDPAIPPLIYVVESDMGQRFLLGRGISGRPKFNMIRYIAKSFMELFFEQLKEKDLAQYLILRDAYPFDLQYAAGNFPPYDLLLLPIRFIKIEHFDKEGMDWEARGQHLNGNFKGDTWLIPDITVASGSTITFFLRNGLEHHLPRQVYVFTACGSLEGIQRIYQECQRRHVELIPVFSQSIFEVSKVGDPRGSPPGNLFVVSPASITTQDFHERAFDRYQGTRLCSVGNIGESLDDPIQYSIHTLQEMQVLGMDPGKEDWTTWTVNVRDKKFQQRVSDLNPSLLEYFSPAWR